MMVLCHSMMYGQNYIDILSLTCSTTPSNSFKESATRTSIDDYQLDISLPIPLNSRTYVLTGLNLNKTSLTLHPLASRHSLYRYGLDIGLYRVLSEKKGLTFIVRPQVCSDQKSLELDDTQWGILALYSTKRRENLKYSYGLYYKQEYYGPLFVPLFGIYYLNSSGRWEFNIMAPINMTCYRHLSTKAALGVQFEGFGTTYKLYDSFSGDSRSYVARTTNELFGFYQYSIWKSLVLKIDLGYSFFRSYKIFDRTDTVNFSLASIYFGDDRTVLNTAFNDGFIFRAGLKYRLQTK